MIKWANKREVDVPPMLDTAYLQRLQKHLGEDVTRELMADGIIELSDRLDRLGALVGEGQVGELRKLTHDITGAAGHLGLSALSFFAAEANRTLREAGADERAGAMEKVLACKARSLDALARFCKIGQVVPPSAVSSME